VRLRDGGEEAGERACRDADKRKEERERARYQT
jgi:hypothetical protein